MNKHVPLIEDEDDDDDIVNEETIQTSEGFPPTVKTYSTQQFPSSPGYFVPESTSTSQFTEIHVGPSLNKIQVGASLNRIQTTPSNSQFTQIYIGPSLTRIKKDPEPVTTNQPPLNPIHVGPSLSRIRQEPSGGQLSEIRATPSSLSRVKQEGSLAQVTTGLSTHTLPIPITDSEESRIRVNPKIFEGGARVEKDTNPIWGLSLWLTTVGSLILLIFGIILKVEGKGSVLLVIGALLYFVFYIIYLRYSLLAANCIYLSASNYKESIAKYITKMRKAKPEIIMSIECFHYSSNPNAISPNSEERGMRTEEDVRKIVTFTETKKFAFDHCEEEAPPLFLERKNFLQRLNSSGVFEIVQGEDHLHEYPYSSQVDLVRNSYVNLGYPQTPQTPNQSYDIDFQTSDIAQEQEQRRQQQQEGEPERFIVDNQRMVKLKLGVSILFDDEYTQLCFAEEQQNFIDLHKTKDTLYRYQLTYHIEGLKPKILCTFGNEPISKIYSYPAYILATFCLMQFPYSYWFNTKCLKLAYTLQKKIKKLPPRCSLPTHEEEEEHQHQEQQY